MKTLKQFILESNDIEEIKWDDINSIYAAMMKHLEDIHKDRYSIWVKRPVYEPNQQGCLLGVEVNKKEEDIYWLIDVHCKYEDSDDDYEYKIAKMELLNTDAWGGFELSENEDVGNLEDIEHDEFEFDEEDTERLLQQVVDIINSGKWPKH